MLNFNLYSWLAVSKGRGAHLIRMDFTFKNINEFECLSKNLINIWKRCFQYCLAIEIEELLSYWYREISNLLEFDFINLKINID